MCFVWKFICYVNTKSFSVETKKIVYQKTILKFYVNLMQNEFSVTDIPNNVYLFIFREFIENHWVPLYNNQFFEKWEWNSKFTQCETELINST